MFNIISLPSGFFAMEAKNGNISHPDLIRWDGKKGTYYPYDVESDHRTEYYINAENTVYYSEIGGIDARIWCPGSRLNAHCHHLAQIRAR